MGSEGAWLPAPCLRALKAKPMTTETVHPPGTWTDPLDTASHGRSAAATLGLQSRRARPAEAHAHGPATRSADYVTIPVAAAMTGYSAKAIRRKIESGIWLEGREFRRAPDGHVLISVKGYELWVERGRA